MSWDAVLVNFTMIRACLFADVLEFMPEVDQCHWAWFLRQACSYVGNGFCDVSSERFKFFIMFYWVDNVGGSLFLSKDISVCIFQVLKLRLSTACSFAPAHRLCCWWNPIDQPPRFVRTPRHLYDCWSYWLLSGGLGTDKRTCSFLNEVFHGNTH